MTIEKNVICAALETIRSQLNLIERIMMTNTPPAANQNIVNPVNFESNTFDQDEELALEHLLRKPSYSGEFLGYPEESKEERQYPTMPGLATPMDGFGMSDVMSRQSRIMQDRMAETQQRMMTGGLDDTSN